MRGLARVLTAHGHELEAAADELVGLAKAAGGRDNITLVIGEFTGAALTSARDTGPAVEEEGEFRLPVKRWPRAAAVALVLGTLTASNWWMLGRDGRATAKLPGSAAEASPRPAAAAHPSVPANVRAAAVWLWLLRTSSGP